MPELINQIKSLLSNSTILTGYVGADIVAKTNAAFNMIFCYLTGTEYIPGDTNKSATEVAPANDVNNDATQQQTITTPNDKTAENLTTVTKGLLLTQGVANATKIASSTSSIVTAAMSSGSSGVKIATNALTGAFGIFSLIYDFFKNKSEFEKEFKNNNLANALQNFVANSKADDLTIDAINNIVQNLPEEADTTNKSFFGKIVSGIKSGIQKVVDKEKHPTIYKFVVYNSLPLLMNVFIIGFAFATGNAGLIGALVGVGANIFYSIVQSATQATNSIQRDQKAGVAKAVMSADLTKLQGVDDATKANLIDLKNNLQNTQTAPTDYRASASAAKQLIGLSA